MTAEPSFDLLPGRSDVNLAQLTDDEWDLVLAWAEDGRSIDRDSHLAHLQSQGVSRSMIEAVRIILELPPPSDDPDHHRSDERIGTEIELRCHLCDSGSGPVYLAVYGRNQQPITVKFRRCPRDPSRKAALVEHWMREVKRHQELSLGGAVPAFVESGEYMSPDGVTWLYLCSEYKHGLTPTQHCREFKLDLGARLYLFLQICDVVSLLYERGIVHGDLKPGNFVVTVREGATHVWLLDFGLTLTMGRSWAEFGAAVGTPGYAAPEQLSQRSGTVRESTDVFSLGLILFELVDGRRWMDDLALDPEAYVERMRLQPPPRTMQVVPTTLRDALNEVLAHATAWEQEERYPQVSIVREEVWKLLKQITPSTMWRALHNGDRPYRGLRPFGERHAESFHGRKRETDQLIELLVQHPWVTLIAASGSGKSSLLQAGVLPALRTADDSWVPLFLRPGSRPLRELALRLDVPGCSVDEIEVALERPDFLCNELERASVRGPAERRFVVIVDQFEELFTQCEDDDDRRAFIAALLRVARSPQGRVRVLIAVRADFSDRLLQEPDLWRCVEPSHLLLGPLGEDGLRDAIRLPAARAGLELEPGLEDLLVHAVSEEPGGLPLLQFVLDQLWEQREGRYLTKSAYAQMDGLKGLIARRADAEHAKLATKGDEDVVRQIFGRLVRLAPGAPPTRCRLSRRDLAQLHANVQSPLEDLIQARLLTADGEHIELAHEALIREWPLLQRWIQEDHERLLTHQLVAQASAIWAPTQDHEDLLTGNRLREALDRCTDTSLTATERRFLKASIARRDKEELRVLHATQARAQRNQLATFLALAFVAFLAFFTTVLAGALDAHDSQSITNVLRAIAYAVKAQAGAVSDQFRQRAEWVVEMAQDPGVVSHTARVRYESSPLLCEHAKGKFQYISVYDRTGVLTAQCGPAMERSVGHRYDFRNYYAVARERGLRGIRKPYVAYSFLSDIDGFYKFGISIPLFRGDEWAGVLLATVLTDKALGPIPLLDSEDPRLTGVLIGPRDRDRNAASIASRGDYIVLVHDKICSGCSTRLPTPLANALREKFGSIRSEDQFAVSSADAYRIEDYGDPVPGMDGRWLAAFAPVGNTGFIVGVQTRYDAAMEPNERFRLNLIQRTMALASVLGAAAAIILGAGLLRQRRARL
jgi:serine/threonine protein kinase